MQAKRLPKTVTRPVESVLCVRMGRGGGLTKHKMQAKRLPKTVTHPVEYQIKY